jgi:hypothetical protein
MAHINLADGLPGIAGLLTSYPETAKHLRSLAEEMLRGPSSLTLAERELIATYASAQSDCTFCDVLFRAMVEQVAGLQFSF